MTTKELIDEIISLPFEERAILADTLLRSLNPVNEENDKKWAAEAKRRLKELRSGSVKAKDGEDVFDQIWKRFER